MSTGRLPNAPRRGLNDRQLEFVEAILEACGQLLEELGYEKVTVRLVADRASVSAATAYMFFSSKEHLFAELFLRRLLRNPPLFKKRSPRTRVAEVALNIAQILESSPELAGAANRALLSNDGDVVRIRAAIGTLWLEWFTQALGDEAYEGVLEALIMTVSSVFLMAGVGDAKYSDLPAVLERTIGVILR